LCEVQSLNVHQKDKASDVLVIRKGQYPIMCIGAILLLQLAEKHLEILRPACKLPGKQGKSSH
jgi:hypothetical protein